MAPTPSENQESVNTPPRSILAGARLAHPDPGDEVVITGLSGRFPDSNDVYEFRDKLFNKVDLVSDDGRRWKLDHPEIPQRTGKINMVSKFDASFFGVHYKQAHTMDPMCRMLLERAYEAIVDAGFNPRHLKGARCGVFIGACFSESEKTWFYEKIQINGFGITGCSRAMLANRISYWLGVNGPSYTVDSACSSSLYALEHAYKAIRDGHCDSALVGGSNLCLHPYVSLQFSRLGVLSQDGSCKSFDNSANGYCRSEAIPMIFLQKKKDARRIYATVVHAKTNCDGYKEQGITYPSGHMQYELLREFYEECGINPTSLNFVEAHGTGTKVGDPEECNALDKIFCTGRKGPLWIGSVKSNIGHSEPASGLCSVTKVLIAMESGYIPPNLHFTTPREGIPAFKEGRMRVVTEKQEWEGGLAGINSFGFGGANCHVLLKWNEKEKINGGAPKDNVPRLVVVSGRTEEACKVMLDELESKPVDVEYVKLMHEVHSEEIPGHIYRGFTVLTNTERKIRDIQYYTGEKKKIWFVFSGMGSQWPGMGKSLMKIPIFAAAVEKCHSVLQPKGVDLMKIVTDEDPKIFDNILHSFVGIAAIQIGLVDTLKSIGILPDNIIGHSVGELGCAYADGCFTAEQMILAAYYRGLASIETEFIKGSMAAVGLGYKKIKDMVPPEIEVACHNGPDSCTISGPQDAMKKFIAELTAQGVFAREVPCSNIAYHSRYIAKAGPKLLHYLQKIIPHPIPRSSKWICTSIPECDWNTPLAKHSSAEYHTNNLLNSVLFEEASKHIPKNAITIEIAPHGLLQAILRRSLSKETTNVALTQRGHADNSQVLLTGIGKLYEVGVQVQLQNLYPHVPYPVSRGTPMISPLVRWEHSEEWYVTSYRLQEKIKSGERTISISLSDEDMEFLAGHVIDGRNLFPATGYLALVWETIGMMKGELYTQLSIVFENVRFNRATNIPKEGTVDFTVMVQKGSGNFEVVEGGAPIVTGRAYVPEHIKEEMAELPPLEPEDEELKPLTARDIYKELKLRGYHYSGLFRGLLSLSGSGSTGKISWANNYVAFMDNMLQTQILQEDTRSLYVPTSIQKLVIDAKKHMQMIHEMDPEGEQSFNIQVHKDVNVITAGGIEIRNLKASQIPRRKPLGDPVLEKYLFVPHIVPAGKKQDLSFLETIRLCVHLALENVQGIKVKVTEVGDETVLPESAFAAPHVASILGDLPLIQAEIILLASSANEKAKDLGAGVTVEDKKISADQSNLIVIGSNVLGRTELLQQGLGAIKAEGFLIVRENPTSQLQLDGFHVWIDRVVDGERILLLRKKGTANTFPTKPEVVKISEKDGFNWLAPLRELVKNADAKCIVLVAENEMTNGLLGLTNCLRKEIGGERIRCVFVMDKTAPPFDITDPFYAEQLDKELAVNVYKHGQWGSYRHQALPETEKVLVEEMYLNNSVRGDLSSFRFYESPLTVNKHYTVGPKSIAIYYSSINFRDVMIASGKLATDVVARGRLEQEIIIGFEFAGRYKESGKRVMGMISRGALTSVIGENSCGYLSWDVPDNWTLEEAATIPVVYGTVYTALITCGRMKKGDSILIHSGTGGVGLAAINVALFYGCTVFTTVGTPEKREYLRKMYPQIPDNHIGNSRDCSFEQMIQHETNGRGVDLVLNSLAEEKLLASVRCLARHGRFLEIGKYDLANNNPIGMEAFLRGISFHGVQLDAIFNADEVRKRELTEIVQWALESGAIKPLKTTVFDVSECEQAFRYMTTGKHMGKVLLKVRDEEPDKVAIPKQKLFAAEPRFFASDKKTYVIIGGLGGFGLELTDWLAIRGARKIVLTSRSGIRTGYQAFRTRIWKSYGAEVVISTEDITTEEGVTNMLKQANALGPVDAIFNLAVVLRDALFENQTEEDYKISFGGKAVATQHLDKVSRKLCPELKYFVVFSSVSCGRGNAGQTNYGMANSIMERICEARVQDGLPGLAVQWGAIGDVGLVADMQEDHQELVIGGTLQQSISSCLQCMDVLLKQKHPVVASMVVAEKRAGGSGSGDIVGTVVNIMGIRDLKTVSLHSSLAELGMDSMMAVEIKQTLEREFEVFLTAQDIRSLTFAKLAELGQKNEEAMQSTADKKTVESGRAVDKTVQGLNLILRLVGEEFSAAEPIIALDSKFGDAMTNAQTPTAANPPVFLIPGLEGMAAVFTNFAKNINSPTLCLQYPYNDTANSDLKKIASQMFSIIKTRLPNGVPFILVAHSTGSIIALELALLLEAEGRTGKLFILDGSPDLLKTLCTAAFGNGTEEEIDTDLLMNLHNLFVPGTNEHVRGDLNKFTTWKDKLEHLMSILPDTVPHSRRHQQITAFDLRQRLKAIMQYEKNYHIKLMLKITLIRPVEQVMPDVMPEDYHLSKFAYQPIKVHFVEGNHLTMLDNRKVAQIINQACAQDEDSTGFKTNLMNVEGNPMLQETQKHKTH